MRLGVDITPLQTASSGGIGTSTYETLEALAGIPGIEIVLYGTAPPLIPFSARPLDLDLPVRLGSGGLARSNIFWLRYGVSSLLARDGIDVFWGTRQVLPALPSKAALVATLYDFWHVHHPQQQPLLNRTLNRYSIATTMKRGDVFSAISFATAQDARRLFPQAAHRVEVNLLGVDTKVFAPAPPRQVETRLEALGVNRPYILLLDVYNQRKNAEAVLQAAASIAGGFEIVALGRSRSTAERVDVAQKAEALGLSPRMKLLGDVPFDDLRALYSGALALVYPSVYEGFGMPVLEAMACGCPVITSNRSSLPEVAGDAAMLVDPTSAPEIAGAIASLVSDADQRDRLRLAGLARAELFTWRRTAEGMLGSFERALDARGSRR